MSASAKLVYRCFGALPPQAIGWARVMLDMMVYVMLFRVEGPHIVAAKGH
jgi:hypothetical protein